MTAATALHRLRARLTGLLVVLAVVASGCSALGAPSGYELVAQFERTYNLFPGSPVRVLGVDVGVVKEVETSPEDDFVTVTFLVEDEISIPDTATAIIIPGALLGERYIQLQPAFTDGDTALGEGAVIPLFQTIVPSEFDEVLESLNNFVGEIDDAELARLVSNLADTLDGNGEALGQTIDAARGAIDVLRENDDDLIALVSRLSDLNETLGTRDQELGRLIRDLNTVMTSLSDDRVDIDAALGGLVRVSNELATLLERHRPDLQADIETLTRVGRTAQRNLDQISLSVLSQAELFRHASRVVNTQKNWLPLVDHAGELADQIAEAVGRRLVGVCLRAGLDPAQCENLAVGELVPSGICLPPIVTCPPADSEEAEDTLTIGDTLRRVIKEMPELEDALREEAIERQFGAEPSSSEDEQGGAR